MTKVDELLEEAMDILRNVDGDLLDDGRLKVTRIKQEDNGFLIANVRGANGYPVVAPHPEAQSMLVARPVYFDLLADGPRIIRALVDLVENRQNQPKSSKNDPESA